MRPNSQKIIGLAGHIDHGKTALVKALTGTDTDSLKEEKARGVTIDIGFAFYNDSTTLIDVPGHEKFVKNMVTGVSTVHMALLVIAADDGVMPQTREHLEIISLLGIKKLIVVINKVDMVDEDWLKLIYEDVKAFVREFDFEDVECLPVSAIKGTGIKELRKSIDKKLSEIQLTHNQSPMRQTIDRVFSIKGFGTVVTGTVLSQDIRVGQKVCLYPQNIELNVRGIQSHNISVDKAKMGDRAAINLNNISVNELRRGNFIGAPNSFDTGHFWLARMNVLKTWPKPVKDATQVQIHLGTGKMQASLHLLEKRDIKASETQLVQIKFKQAMSSSRKDRFVIRAMSPELTLGGGEILWMTPKHIRRGNRNLVPLQSYESDKNFESILILMQFLNSPVSRIDLVKKLNLSFSKVDALVKNDAFIHHNDTYYIREYYDEISMQIIAYLKKQHELHPSENGFELRKLENVSHEAMNFVLAKNLHDKAIIKEKELYGLPGHGATLQEELLEKYEALKTKIIGEGFTFPGWKTLAKQDESYDEILSWMIKKGELLHIEEDYYLLKIQVDTLINNMKSHFKTNACLSLDDAKALINASRKYLIPLLNYLERKSWIKREGDCRKWIGELER